MSEPRAQRTVAPTSLRFPGKRVDKPAPRLGPNDALTYEYDEMRGRGFVAKGRVAVYEGDGQRVIVMTKDDGTMTTRVSKSLP